MALEIREIEVRMRVGDAGAPSGDGPSEGGCAGEGSDESKRADLVNECVRRVLAVLDAKRER